MAQQDDQLQKFKKEVSMHWVDKADTVATHTFYHFIIMYNKLPFVRSQKANNFNLFLLQIVLQVD